MSPWKVRPSLDQLNHMRRGTMVEYLDIRITELGEDFLRATMPVDHRTVQTMGILHGGASVALAETVGSFAANLSIDPAKQACVGQDINANHLRPVAAGSHVTATARPVHIGTRSQVWQIDIHDDRERLVCVSRLTMAVINRPAESISKDKGKAHAL